MFIAPNKPPGQCLPVLLFVFLFVFFVTLFSSCAGINTDSFLDGKGLGLDRRALQVTNTEPASDETGVEPDTDVAIFFSKEVDSSSLNTATLTVEDSDGNAANGTIVYDPQVSKAVFTPDEALSGLTDYTVTVHAGIETTDLNILEKNYVFIFTTRDTAPPEISSVYPNEGATGISDKVEIQVTFNDDMNASTVNASTFTLSQDGDTTAGVVEYDSETRTATLRPGSELTLKGSTPQPLPPAWPIVPAILRRRTTTGSLPPGLSVSGR